MLPNGVRRVKALDVKEGNTLAFRDSRHDVLVEEVEVNGNDRVIFRSNDGTCTQIYSQTEIVWVRI